MVGRRCLTVFASAAALLLIASGGAAWGDPGNGHAYGHSKGHRGHHGAEAHAQGHRSAHHHTDGSGGLEPAVRGTNSTSNGGKATARNSHGRDTGHGHWKASNLAAHPGKARGLVKRLETGNPQGQQHDPAETPAPAVEVSQPLPTQPLPTSQQSGGDNSRPSSNRPDNQPTDRPSSPPPPTSAPDNSEERSLARLLPRAADLRFTALPLIITLGLALCIGGLIRLARHRA